MLPNEQLEKELVDTPIFVDEEPETTIDSPMADMPTLEPENEFLNNFKAIKAAYIDNYINGTPVVEAYQKHRGDASKDVLLTRLAAQKAEEDAITSTEVLEEIAATDPEVYYESVEAEAQLREAREQESRDPTKQFVDSIASPELDEEGRAALVNYIKLYELYESVDDGVSGSSVIADAAKGFIPFRETINEMSTLGGAFNNEEKVIKMIQRFKRQPFEEQQEMFPQLAEELIDGFGPIKGMNTLSQFIEPNSETELTDFANAWKLLDIADISGIAGSVAKLIKLKARSANVPKMLKMAENEERAGEAAAAAMADEGAAKAMNMSKETAAGDALAFDISLEDPAYTKGISAPTIKATKEYFGKADRTIDDIIQGNGYLGEGILNNVERAVREDIAIKQLKNAEHENITIAERSDNSTTFQFQARGDDGGIVDQQFTLDLARDDVGQWKQSEFMVGSEFISSPTVFAKGLTRLDVNTAQRLDDQTAKVFRDLTKLQNEALKPLGSRLNPFNRKKLEAVENALRAGDEYLDEATGVRGEVFDVETLSGTYGLDDNQISVYYRTNRLYNNLWRLRNNAKRDEMLSFKFKKVSFSDNEFNFGKQHDTAGDAYNSLRTAETSKVFDAVEDRVIEVAGRDLLDEQYALGKVLVRVPEGHQIGGGRGKFTHVLVNSDSVTELPAVVLNRKRGYVPRISENGHWFVKELGKDIVNGAPQDAVVKTHRYFDNKADAETFTQELIDNAVEEDGLTLAQATDKYKFFEDREQEIISTATGTFSHGSGGLYTAHRSEDGILFGLNGDEATRVRPYEALVRNIANISRMVPINQWRLGLEQRWINTARELTGADIQGFGTLPDGIEATRAGEFLNKMAKQIRDWQGFPSKSEQVYQGLSQRMYEYAVKSQSTTGAKITGWMRDKDPVAASRAAAFHALLGWFNPAQLWVQAQGMAIAVSINLGKNLTETLKHTTGLTVLGHGEGVSKGRITLAAKAAGLKPEELLNIHKIWKKTGLEDSILQTADHAAAIRGHGVAMDAISKAADKGLFFYRGGELLNRRMSFTTALDELYRGEIKGFESYKGKSKAASVDDDALRAVLDRTHNLMLNMSKANRAEFQKGLLSVPTQFFQVSAKALESVAGFNNNFTKAERGRIMAGQIALYGTAGIPLANLGVNYLTEVLGITQEEIDNNPTLVKTWNDGFWGFVTMGVMGVDVEMSSRGSLARGVTDFAENWMFSESTVGEKMLGAFGATGTRFWDSFTKQMRPLMFGAYSPDIIDIAKIPTMPFLQTISTWKNYEKAEMMESLDVILDKRGNVAVKRPFELREAFMAAIGFQLSDEVKAWSLQQRVQRIQELNGRIADTIIARMNDVALRDAQGRLSEEYIQETEQMYAFMYGTLDWERQKDVREIVRRRIGSDSTLEKSKNRYLDKVVGNTTASLSLLIDGLTGTNVQTLSDPEEK